MTHTDYEVAEDFEENIDNLYTDEEVRAGSGRTTPFTLEDVKLAARRVAAANVVSDFERWRKEDEDPHVVGGRPRTSPLGDWHILVGCLLLAREHSPLWISELRNLFWFRLTPDAAEFLGLKDVITAPTQELAKYKWNNHTSRAFHRLLDVVDGYPAPRQIMNKSEREAVQGLRDKNESRRKKERLDVFSNKMLEMTFGMLRREVRRQWKGSISIDQTEVKAPSPRGIARKVNGEEVRDSLVMEIDAGWHTRDPDSRGTHAAANATSSTWAYEGNFAAIVGEDPNTDAKHPQIILGFTLSRPNEDIGGETVRILDSLIARNHPRGRITADKGYFANILPEHLMYPVRARGYEPLFDYYKNRLGKRGGQRGAIQVEGAYLCPATPEKLINANKLIVLKEERNAKIATERDSWEGLSIPRRDLDRRTAYMEERKKYALRQKMAPTSDGDVKLMCPAEGISATAECPLKALHPKASTKTDRAIITNPPTGDLPDICAQHIVTMTLGEESRWLQNEAYKTQKWQDKYSTDRNVIEGFNGFIKDTGHENLESSGRRRMRGLTAQQFIVTFLIVSANMRKIFTFLRDMDKEESAKPPRKRRRRNHLSLKNYRTRLTTTVAEFGRKKRNEPKQT
jgi:hypothetical protein